MKENLQEKNVDLLYVQNKKERSLTISRNIGIAHCLGDVIVFLDNDVILDKNYIAEVLRAYREIPDAVGVQGIIPSLATKQRRHNTLNRLCFSFHTEKKRCRILPSASNTYPYEVDEVIECQWLSGGNSSYKREILQNFKFDENLKKYAFKEDMDLSYRVFKQYPGSLYMTPYAKLIHNEPDTGRISNKERIYMQQVYTFYFFYKNIDQTLKNKLIFYWSVTSLLVRASIGHTTSLMLKPSKLKVERLKHLLASHVLCLKRLKELKNGDLEFFNEILN